ncbi:NUDIX hydrolase [Rhizobium johnstonii]|uniref:NUDIX domain-containing protein n=1 Tax=Rhizobium leguminosarum bv. viciae TaxID=387 RepID=A0A8G2MS05_RHILV|nr:NUDIX domain-containing protein [Rhizobium leguminosarum]WSG94014.1 NUDIX domain-containing protein [Rhizobium johnstonii]MBB4504557.1 mutator protein MutT [Rhizobium leguminosarum]MBY5319137.1 NUDIX domain-containing protein [Rhizobium leguminosarum]MBY5380635.1 NUDIX domain-containing protein [Rhizobium leguminosarum]MBY5386662.1 NUDIX domain-containing protein [Rhizobium leguminosarum]
MPEIAMGALIQNGTVLLARRSSRRTVHPDRWSLPGGHVEEGEDAETAMCRELIEEIGVTPELWQFAGKFASEGLPEASVTFHVYRIDQWHGYPRMVDDEHTELRWFGLAAIEGEAELAPPQLGEMLAELISWETGKPA